MRGLQDIEQALTRTSRSSDLLGRNLAASFRTPLASITAFRGAIIGLASALGVRQIISYGDAFVGVQNQLRVAGVASGDLAGATEEIFNIANRTRAPVNELAQLYSRVSLSASELSISQQEVAHFTELVGQAIATQGASTGAVQGALLQLSQALGGTVIQMQEFNSLIDGARPLLEAAAAGILEAGGSVSKLRQMVLDGKLSNEEFFQGIVAGSSIITERFATTVPTVSQALTVLNNSMTELIGGASAAGGATDQLSQSILDLAETLGRQEFRDFATSIMAGIAEEMRDAAQSAYELFQAVEILAQGLGAFDDTTGLSEALALPDLGDLDLARNTLSEIAGILDLIGQTDLAAKVRELNAIELPEFEKGVGEFARPKTEIEPISAGDVERQDKGRKKATFSDIINQLERELELTGDITLARDQINAIQSAELRLKRELTDAERERLLSVQAVLGAHVESRDAQLEIAQIWEQINAGGLNTEEVRVQAAYLRDLAEGGQEFADAMRQSREEQEAAASALTAAQATTRLEQQIEDLRLISTYGGQETQHYREHAAALQLKRELLRDLTAEEAQLVALLARESTRRDVSTAMTGLRQRREQADFEISQAPEAQMAGVFGLPPRQEFFARQQRFEFQQQGLGAAEIATMEPMIQDMARAEQHLVLMNETAPQLASTLAGIGQIAVFEGLEAAGERFLQMLVDMIFQAVALQIIMAALGVAGVGATGAAPAAAPGVGPGGMGFLHFGGPRQHGGRARRGEAVLVGEAGRELFVPDTSGRVLSHTDTTRALSGGGGGAAAAVTVNAQPTINVIDQRVAGSPPVSVNQRAGAGGGAVVDVLVADSLDRMHSGGQLDRMMTRRTGVRRS